MAVNVTEKDKTLNEIIDWCEQMEADGLRLASALLRQHDMAAYSVMQRQISGAYEKTADLPILRLQARGGVRRFLEATDGMSRKPPQWMRRFAPEGNPAHLFPVVCAHAAGARQS